MTDTIQLHTGVETSQHRRSGMHRKSDLTAIAVIKLLQQIRWIWLQVIVQWGSRFAFCIQVHKAGAISGKIQCLQADGSIGQHFAQAFLHPGSQPGQIFAGKSVFVLCFFKLFAFFQYNIVLLIEEKQFFIGLSNIEDCYDGSLFRVSGLMLRVLNYNPVATVFCPRSLIRFSRTFNSRNNCMGCNAPFALNLASATIGRTSVR
jgi:hypothetical protein